MVLYGSVWFYGREGVEFLRNVSNQLEISRSIPIGVPDMLMTVMLLFKDIRFTTARVSRRGGRILRDSRSKSLRRFHLHGHRVKAHAHQRSPTQHVLPYECLDVTAVTFFLSARVVARGGHDHWHGLEEPHAGREAQRVLENVGTQCCGAAEAR